MKRNFSAVLLDLDGTAIKRDPEPGKPLGPEGPPPATLGFVCLEALMTPIRGDENIGGEAKFKMYQLAGRIHKGGWVEVTPEEVAQLKERLGKGYTPRIIGPAFVLLDADPPPAPATDEDEVLVARRGGRFVDAAEEARAT